MEARASMAAWRRLVGRVIDGDFAKVCIVVERSPNEKNLVFTVRANGPDSLGKFESEKRVSTIVLENADIFDETWEAVLEATREVLDVQLGEYREYLRLRQKYGPR